MLRVWDQSINVWMFSVFFCNCMLAMRIGLINEQHRTLHNPSALELEHYDLSNIHNIYRCTGNLMHIADNTNYQRFEKY